MKVEIIRLKLKTTKDQDRF